MIHGFASFFNAFKYFNILKKASNRITITNQIYYLLKNFNSNYRVHIKYNYFYTKHWKKILKC